MEFSVKSRSPAETHEAGRLLGRLLRGQEFICLRGTLGAGKTVLAQGIAGGLGVLEPVCSPTFALVHEYAGRLAFCHVDAYRLTDPREGLELGLGERLTAGAVVVVEWPERLDPVLPHDRLEVNIDVEANDDRILRWVSKGDLPSALLDDLEPLIASGRSP